MKEAVISTTGVNRQINKERYNILVNFCVNEGVVKDKAEYYIYKYAKEVGITIIEEEEKPQPQRPQPSNNRDKSTEYSPQPSSTKSTNTTPVTSNFKKYRVWIGLAVVIIVIYSLFSGGGDEEKESEKANIVAVASPELSTTTYY